MNLFLLKNDEKIIKNNKIFLYKNKKRKNIEVYFFLVNTKKNDEFGFWIIKCEYSFAAIFPAPPLKPSSSDIIKYFTY